MTSRALEILRRRRNEFADILNEHRRCEGGCNETRLANDAIGLIEELIEEIEPAERDCLITEIQSSEGHPNVDQG